MIGGGFIGWWFRGGWEAEREHRRITRNLQQHQVTGDVVERARVSREERVQVVVERGWSRWWER